MCGFLEIIKKRQKKIYWHLAAHSNSETRNRREREDRSSKLKTKKKKI